MIHVRIVVGACTLLLARGAGAFITGRTAPRSQTALQSTRESLHDAFKTSRPPCLPAYEAVRGVARLCANFNHPGSSSGVTCAAQQMYNSKTTSSLGPHVPLHQFQCVSSPRNPPLITVTGGRGRAARTQRLAPVEKPIFNIDPEVATCSNPVVSDVTRHVAFHHNAAVPLRRGHGVCGATGRGVLIPHRIFSPCYRRARCLCWRRPMSTAPLSSM